MKLTTLLRFVCFCSVLYAGCIGIEEQKAQSALSLSPNPNNGEFKIQSSNEIKLELSNQLGEKLKTIEITTGEKEIDLDELPVGFTSLLTLKPRKAEK